MAVGNAAVIIKQTNQFEISRGRAEILQTSIGLDERRIDGCWVGSVAKQAAGRLGVAAGGWRAWSSRQRRCVVVRASVLLLL